MENTNTLRIRTEKYDSKYAQFVRELKSTDIVVLAPTLASTAVGVADTSIASTTTDAYHNLYLVEYSMSSSIADGVACISIGTSTYLQRFMSAGGNGLLANNADTFSISGRKDSPLLRVPESTTVALRYNALTAGTVTGYAVFIKEPLPAYIETE